MDGTPAAAESIEVHAATRCERHDHLWDVTNQLSLSVDLRTAHRAQTTGCLRGPLHLTLGPLHD